MTSIYLPIAADNSTVLGYDARDAGRSYWDELDWSWWYPDKTPDAARVYLHVRVKQDPSIGEVGDEFRQYRVRCRHDIGQVLNGRTVVAVRIGYFDNRPTWLVDVS